MEIDKIKDINDIEEILYDGTKEDIETVIKMYEVSYEYCEKYRSFSSTSMKLLETVKGYKSHYTPNCVKYFGNKYEYKE